MTIHLIKMCVGIDSVEHLAEVQARRLAQARAEVGAAEARLRHFTRHMPRRAEELAASGSLYWVVRGFVAVRQRILACERRSNGDGTKRCAIVLDTELVRTELRAQRPFQGWRYLAPDKAPPDIKRGRGAGAGLPPEMAEELRALGLL